MGRVGSGSSMQLSSNESNVICVCCALLVWFVTIAALGRQYATHQV